MTPVAAIGALVADVVPLATHEPEISPLVRGIAGMALTLVVGGLLLLLAPTFTDRATFRIHNRPGRSFLYGLGVTILAIVVILGLVITIIGIVLAIPLVFVLLFLGEVGYLAVGRLVSENRWVMLLVAMVVTGIVGAVPVLGGVIAFVISTLGTGAASLEMYHRHQEW